MRFEHCGNFHTKTCARTLAARGRCRCGAMLSLEDILAHDLDPDSLNRVLAKFNRETLQAHPRVRVCVECRGIVDTERVAGKPCPFGGEGKRYAEHPWAAPREAPPARTPAEEEEYRYMFCLSLHVLFS